jgi:hypothetical protein
VGANERADALVRTTCAIADAQLRVGYVRAVLTEEDASELAAALEIVCARAEQADEAAREALVALATALHDPAVGEAVQHLREEAAAAPYLALERLVRQPVSVAPTREVPEPEEDRVPDYGRGRPLTLGERKALARKPDRAMTERLLRDPHPDVIRQLLANPRLTEDDVLALAARRPCRPDVLTEIARAPKWSQRTRIRMALVLNPDTPSAIAAPLTGLLLRHELRLVSETSTVPPAVRALCHEHLERRPPGEGGDPGDGTLQ